MTLFGAVLDENDRGGDVGSATGEFWMGAEHMQVTDSAMVQQVTMVGDGHVDVLLDFARRWNMLGRHQRTATP